MRYLKEYRRTVYLNLSTSGKLNGYLADIEEQAQERFERIVEQTKQVQGHRTAKGEKHRRMDRESEQYTSVCEGDCG